MLLLRKHKYTLDPIQNFNKIESKEILLFHYAYMLHVNLHKYMYFAIAGICRCKMHPGEREAQDIYILQVQTQ